MAKRAGKPIAKRWGTIRILLNTRAGRVGILLAVILAISVILGEGSRAAGLAFHGPSVQRPTPDFQLAQSLSEKEALDNRYAEALETGKQAPAPRIAVQSAPGLPALESPVFREGIIDGEPGPFSSTAIFVENLWQTKVADGFIQVFAGAQSGDLEQGILVILSTHEDRIQGSEQWVETPERSGAVRIVAVDGDLLVLHSSQGKRFSFDLLSRQFVDR